MANDDASIRHFWLHFSLAVIVPDIENIEFTGLNLFLKWQSTTDLDNTGVYVYIQYTLSILFDVAAILLHRWQIQAGVT